MKHYKYLILAGVLIILSALLLIPEKSAETIKAPLFPNKSNKNDVARTAQRLKNVKLLVEQYKDKPEQKTLNTDPYLLVLAEVFKNDSYLNVLELGAFKKTKTGDMALRCILKGSQRKALENLEKDYGFNPVEDFERIAFTETGMLIEGNFKFMNWDKIEKEGLKKRKLGDTGTLYEITEKDEQMPYIDSVSLVAENMIYMGDAKKASQIADILEGRQAVAEYNDMASFSYGEIYGRAPLNDMTQIFPDEMREKMKNALSTFNFHIDMSEGLAIAAHFSGTDTELVKDLAKTMGAGLSAYRLKAAMNNDQELKELLDFAEVENLDNGKFDLKMALPSRMIEAHLQRCIDAPEPSPESKDEPENLLKD